MAVFSFLARPAKPTLAEGRDFMAAGSSASADLNIEITTKPCLSLISETENLIKEFAIPSAYFLNWTIDRIIAAYIEGAKIQFSSLPEANREELIRDFIDDLRNPPQERLVTVADIEAAEAYEQAQRKRWAALDRELGI